MANWGEKDEKDMKNRVRINRSHQSPFLISTGKYFVKSLGVFGQGNQKLIQVVLLSVDGLKCFVVK